VSPAIPDSVFLDYVERLRRRERQAAMQHPVIWHGSVPTEEDLKRAAADRRVWLAGPPAEVVWPSPLARWQHVKAKAAAVWAALP
jgi:hypothetical protein